MNTPNVTKQPETPATSAPASGSVAKPASIAEWFRYLTETEQLHDYWSDGSEKSKAIEAGFGAWKATQGGIVKPLNDEAH